MSLVRLLTATCVLHYVLFTFSISLKPVFLCYFAINSTKFLTVFG